MRTSKVRTLAIPREHSSAPDQTPTMSIPNHIAARLMPSPRKRDAGLCVRFAHEGASIPT